MKLTMNELEQLRAEIAELREATKLMLALTTSVLAGSRDSAHALVGLMADVGEATATRAPGSTFDAMSMDMLRAVSSMALKQHPRDQEVREIYRALRPGERH